MDDVATICELDESGPVLRLLPKQKQLLKLSRMALAAEVRTRVSTQSDAAVATGKQQRTGLSAGVLLTRLAAGQVTAVVRTPPEAGLQARRARLGAHQLAPAVATAHLARLRAVARQPAQGAARVAADERPAADVLARLVQPVPGTRAARAAARVPALQLPLAAGGAQRHQGQLGLITRHLLHVPAGQLQVHINIASGGWAGHVSTVHATEPTNEGHNKRTIIFIIFY